MTSPEMDLLTGLATLLGSVSIGVYKTTAYAPTDIGITFGGLAQVPTQQIALTTYPVRDDPAPSNDSVVGVQVMLRGDETLASVKNLSGAIFNQFEGLTNRWFGQMFVPLMWRQTGRLDGKDSNNRWLSVESYYAMVNWPALYRTE